MREYQYEIQYVKGKNNYVADQLSRMIRIVARPPAATWVGLDRQQIKTARRNEPAWKELTIYLEGERVPARRLPRATLDQFSLIHKILELRAPQGRRQSTLHFGSTSETCFTRSKDCTRVSWTFRTKENNG